jgi:hypothetical protein
VYALYLASDSNIGLSIPKDAILSLHHLPVASFNYINNSGERNTYVKFITKYLPLK